MGEEFKDFEVEAPVLTLEPDLTEEKEAIERADKSIAKNGTVPHDAVDWD